MGLTSMNLRTKLALALTLTALLPMGIAVGVPMLQAERRADAEASRRLEEIRRQAGVLIERQRRDVAERVERLAVELAVDRAGRQILLQGPAAVVRSVARVLAERYGLDHLEVRDARGMLRAVSEVDPRSDPQGDLSDLDVDEVALRPLPYPSFAADRRVAYFARRPVAAGPDSLTLIGGRAVGHELIEAIGEIAGQPAALVDGSGRAVEAAGADSGSGARIAADVPLGAGGWRVRVSAPAGDAHEVRRDLLVAFAGTVPLAVAGALIAGMLLAAGVSRPIRALAARAETISAEHAGGPLSPLHDEDEIRRLGLAFDRMLEALSQSERQRGAAERLAAWQEVARRIAHEVKNPLSPIQLAVQNLRTARQKSPQDFERSFEEETATILEEVGSLRRLVEEFSQFARLPRPQVVTCDLRPIVSQALALLAPRIEAAGVRVEIAGGDLPDAVRADPEQIGRALKNILTNALDSLEALGPGTERLLQITLRPILGVRQGSRARFAEIEIRDSGGGFEPEALRRVFEPYFTTRAGRGGTGLGMAIAHRIAADHGGSIQAAGAPGRGATITVRLPVEGPPATGGREETCRPS